MRDAIDSSSQAEPGATPHHSMNDHARTVLVIDRNEDVNLILRLMLESQGHRVIAVLYAADAMTVLSRKRVDVVLTNRIEPSYDKGVALPWMIRAIQPGAAIILTNSANGQDRRTPRDAVLPKPFSIAELAKTIAAVA
jgi:CheY-like chemotaxis protein